MTDQTTTFNFVCENLEFYALNGIYSPEDIITRVYERSDGTIDINTPDEVHFAWFKTNCLAVLEELHKQYAHKKQFNAEIARLFEQQNAESRSLWASVERMLWQFRLRGAYQVKDIIDFIGNKGRM